MKDSMRRQLLLSASAFGALTAACVALMSAANACSKDDPGRLLPNIRALPPTDIAMLDATTMQFSTTSWNSGNGKLELVARNPDTVSRIQPVDQRIYCSDGSYYDTPAGDAEYHAEHNHVHYNDYANYIFELESGNQQNPRQGTKTTFCIMDTSAVNTQLNGAASSAGFDWCPTQEPGFNTQGMSVGWGDEYGSNLPGQNLPIGDLPEGTYRLRHVFDPKNRIEELDESDNESCRRVEVFDRGNNRYVSDLGPCIAPPAPVIASIAPTSAQQNTCVEMQITGTNLVPELIVMFTGGTGPLPKASNTRVDPSGNYIMTTVCVPRAKGGKRNSRLGNDPVWDILLTRNYGDTPVTATPNLFTVTP